MYLDVQGWRPPPPEEPPKRSGPNLTPRQQRVFGWILLVNLVLMLVGPLAGSSVIHAVLAMMSRG